MFAQAGLDHRAYRRETLGRRLPACLRALRVTTPALARRILEDRPELLPSALSSMLVGVTSFFRDASVFATLRTEIETGARRNAATKGMYVWSIGCSTGAELYSVALLLAEHRGLLDRSYLIGTDCRSEAIARARRGWFSQEEVDGLPEDLVLRSFLPHRQGWQIVPAVRSTIQWRVSDILRDREAGVWDLILFRNTSMYMQPESTDRIWERLENCLRPGGLLVLGRAERPTGTRRLAPVSSCVWRRTVRPSRHFEPLR